MTDYLTRIDPEYDTARRGYNLAVEHHPAAIAVAENTQDVVDAVREAGRRGLGVAVLATGHGPSRPADGQLLINTSRMTGITVYPEARTARVEAGVRGGDLVRAAAAHGLAPLSGSSPEVGVVSYHLGGGLGLLGRSLGWAVDHVSAIEVVTADGEWHRATATNEPDLFWALRGGGRGTLGVVVAMEIGLHPITRLYGGGMHFAADRVDDVLDLWAEWTRATPEPSTRTTCSAPTTGSAEAFACDIGMLPVTSGCSPTDGGPVTNDDVQAAIARVREDVARLHGELVRYGLVVWTGGNVSGRVPGADLFVIKPSGVSYDDLTPENMILCDLDGNVVPGTPGSDRAPSSDTAAHAYVYRHMPDVGGVVHTHSTYAVAWAARGEEIPCVITAMADEFGGPIPVGPFAIIGDDSIGRGIVETLNGHRSRGVLMQNHGPFTIGKDAKDAVKAAVMLEDVARTVHIARQAGPLVPIPQEAIDSLYNRYQNVYGQSTDARRDA